MKTVRLMLVGLVTGLLLLLAACSEVVPAQQTLETQNIDVGSEGCTPGYWKNTRKHDWPDTIVFTFEDGDEIVNISTSTTLAEVFPNMGLFDLEDDTLLDALNYHGGPSVADAARMMLRHAVAALFNAATLPGYGSSGTNGPVVAVRALVGKAIRLADEAGNRRDGREILLSLKNAFEAANEVGCPLN